MQMMQFALGVLAGGLGCFLSLAVCSFVVYAAQRRDQRAMEARIQSNLGGLKALVSLHAALSESDADPSKQEVN